MTTATKQLQYPKRLLADGDTNTKLRKNGAEFITLGLSMAPHKSAGIGNVCPYASEGCIDLCLDHQGMGSVWQSIHDAREKRTRLYFEDRVWFLDRLKIEIGNKIKLAKKQGKRVAVRLNVFSDIAWETVCPELFDLDCQWYDYSKWPNRHGLLMPNYWVTLSRSEDNETDCHRALDAGHNVAVVFADLDRPYVANKAKLQGLPESWHGYRVIDGDVSDLRFEDDRGCVVGLRCKANSYDERAKALASDFVVKWCR